MEIKKWLHFSLVNLVVVALLGALMRYKIGFEFPYLDQKFLQHAHSNFAFSGWITHTIYVLMLFLLGPIAERRQGTYSKLIAVNLFLAYGMLISFMIQGYGWASITFSTLSIFNGYIFVSRLLKDVAQLDENNPARQWFRAALWFNVVSTIGSFTLVYLMIIKYIHLKMYLAALYFYLHFQYNGFFMFACFGLFFASLNKAVPDFRYHRGIFRLFLAACVPAYLLSTLWAELPNVVYSLAVAAAAIQVVAWGWTLVLLRRSLKSATAAFRGSRYLLLVIAIALSIKLLLQLFSTIPMVGQLAFGFRPIVIAYLHLVLLGIISAFLLTYIYQHRLLRFNGPAVAGLIILFCGIYFNEIVLAVQGIASFSYTPLSHVNTVLFILSVVMLSGIGLLAAAVLKSERDSQPIVATREKLT